MILKNYFSQMFSLKDHICIYLFLLYALNVLVLISLDINTFYPIWVPDEAQYALTGKNLARYGTFSLRGDFPGLIPPLYPLLVCLAQYIPKFSSQFMGTLILNHLCIATVLFSTYGIGRLIGIGKFNAILVGILSLWIFNIYIVTHYMSEVIYYPIFVLCCYLAGRYYLEPDGKKALLFGLSLGAALLTKSSATVLCFAWVFTNLVVLAAALWERRYRTCQIRQAELIRQCIFWPVLSVICAFLIYSPWLILKGLHLGFSKQGILGSYAGTVQGAASVSGFLKWFPLYFSDLFLSAGFISLFLFALGISSLWQVSRGYRSQAIFWVVLLLAVIGMGASISGTVIGDLRERHIFILIPVVYCVVIKGLERIASLKRGIVVVVSLVSSWMLVLVFLGYDFKPYSLFDAMWIEHLANLVPSQTGGLGGETVKIKFVITAAAMIMLFQSVWLFRPSNRARAFLVLSLALSVFYTVKTFRVSESCWQWERSNGRGVLAEWLLNTIGPGRKLLVTGRYSYFQPRPDTYKPDEKLIEWSEAFGLNERAISTFEAVGLYDVRMSPNMEILKKYVSKNEAPFLLTTVQIPFLEPISRFRQVLLYPVNQINPRDLDNLEPHYIAEFNPVHFKSDVGKLVAHDKTHFASWILDGRKGWICLKTGLNLSPGNYITNFHFRPNSPGGSMYCDIYDIGRNGITASREIDVTNDSPMEVRLEVPLLEKGHYQLRLHINNARGSFLGAQIERPTKDISPKGFRVACGSGWYHRESWGRWAKGRVSTIELEAKESQSVKMSFDVFAYRDSGRLRILVNGKTMKKVQVRGSSKNKANLEHVEVVFHVDSGKTIVKLLGPERKTKKDRALKYSEESRDLRLGFTNMKLQGMMLF